MKRGRKSHEPDKATRDTVRLHAMVGTPQEVICRVLGISVPTLLKHYRDELDLSLATANASIGGHLYNKAKGGDTSAMMFWLKTRAGFRERDKEEKQDSNELMAKALIGLVDKLEGA